MQLPKKSLVCLLYFIVFSIIYFSIIIPIRLFQSYESESNENLVDLCQPIVQTCLCWDCLLGKKFICIASCTSSLYQSFHQEHPWVAQRSGSHKKWDQTSLKVEEDTHSQCFWLSLLSHRQYVVYCRQAAPEHWYWAAHNFWSDDWCQVIPKELTIWDTGEWSPWTLMLYKWAFMIPYHCQPHLSCWCVCETFLGFGELEWHHFVLALYISV